MPGSVYDDLKKKQTALIRKALDGSAFIAPYSAPTIAALTDPEDMLLAALPEGYEDLGLVTSDGFGFAREVETSDISAHGMTEPARSDIVSDSSTMTAQAIETKLLTIGLYTGANTDNLRADAASGEVRIDKPTRRGNTFYRMLKISVDLSDAGEIYIARYFPRCKVTDFDEQNFSSDGDNPITWPVTMGAFTDDALGFSESWLFGGPGWNAVLDQMGIEKATAPGGGGE